MLGDILIEIALTFTPIIVIGLLVKYKPEWMLDKEEDE